MSHAANPVNVLLVDDDLIDVKAIQRAFRKHEVEHPLTVAKDGLEALQILRGEAGYEPLKRPLLILLDLNMPRMNGFEFLDAVRSDPQLDQNVVLVLTTSSHDGDRADAYKRKVAGYMVKSHVGDGFQRLTRLLNAYCKVVHLP